MSPPAPKAYWVLRASLQVVSCTPTPSTRTEPTGYDPLAVDVGNHVAITAEKCFCGAHFSTKRKFTFSQTVTPVLLVFFCGVVFLRSTSAEGTLVHLASGSEVTCLRVLWRTEWARVEAISATNAEVLRVENHPLLCLVDAVNRAHCNAGCVGTVHTRNRDRAFARLTVVNRNDATPVDAPGNLVLVFTRGDAGVAFDAALRVAQESHSSHFCVSLSYADFTRHSVTLVSCMFVTESYPYVPHMLDASPNTYGSAPSGYLSRKLAPIQ